MLHGLPYKLALACEMGLHKTTPSVPVYHVPHPSLHPCPAPALSRGCPHPCQGHTSALLGPWWAWGFSALPLAGSRLALAGIIGGGGAQWRPKLAGVVRVAR